MHRLYHLRDWIRTMAGYPEIDTLEDLLPALQKMQEAVPESDSGKQTYAISLFKDWDGNMMSNAKPEASYYGYDEMGFVLAKADGSDYQSLIDSDSAYVRSLKFLFEANQMGLVDPESTTQNYDTLFSKYQDGQILFSPYPWLGQGAYNTDANKEAGKGFMFVPVNDEKIFSYGCQVNGNAQNACIMIGSKAEDPQRLADFIDWLYSPEGIRLNGQSNGAAGIEGLTYEINSDGKPELTDFGKKALPNNSAEVPEEYGGGNWKDGVSALNFKPVNLEDIDPATGEAYDWQTWETTIANNQTELDKDWAEHMGASSTMEYVQNNNMLEVAPGSSYSIPEADSNITTVRGQCKSAVVDNSWKMVFASNDSEFASILKDMQTTAKGLGYDDVLEVDEQNAKDWTAARKASAEKYPTGKNVTDDAADDQSSEN